MEYERFFSTRGEMLTLESGTAPPEKAVPDEWTKREIVDVSKLTEAEKTEISRYGYAYSASNKET